MGIKATAETFNNKLRNKEEPSSVFPQKGKSPVQPDGMSEVLSATLKKINDENRELIRQEFAKNREYLQATLSPNDFNFLEKGERHGNA